MNAPAEIKAGPLAKAESRFFNRELSWLAFNRRVLEEAANPAHPLLERLRFLSISGTNLDEFFSVRVAGLKEQQLEGLESLSYDGLTPTQQLQRINEEADVLVAEQQRTWVGLAALLAEEEVEVVEAAGLEDGEREWLRTHLAEQIFPVLTPQAVDPSHPFPFVPHLGFALVFAMVDPADGERVSEVLMIPASIPRFLRLPGKPRYVAIDDAIAANLHLLFAGFELIGAGAFRVLRDTDIEIEEDAEDLVRTFRSAIKQRRRGRVIRLEFAAGTPADLEALVREGVRADHAFIAESSGFIGIADLGQLVEGNERPDLLFEPYTPRLPERIKEHGGDCFAAIRAKDIVIHHPYESFDVVVAFLRQAAADPDVVAIKQTLYRAGKQSAIVDALVAAAEAGKSVTAVVELKARFDEEQNLLWASRLERAGVQVVYGFMEWKTHAKISMVVRREGPQFRTYLHFGTGNYHPTTARFYTDLSFFTASKRAARDASKVFNFISGYVPPRGLEQLVMSPLALREKLTGWIDAEIANARAGKPAAIWAKMNSLVDSQLIDKLYEASEAGVKIDLIIRGICCLRPGIAGVSSNIRVKSIVGRFLEHSRIWCFANGARLPNAKARVYISSADWMPRNLDRRIEVAVPLENATVRAQVLDQVMVANLIDNEQSWTLDSAGHYTRVKPGRKAFNLHHYFMTNPSLSGRGQALEGKKVPKLKLEQGG